MRAGHQVTGRGEALGRRLAVADMAHLDPPAETLWALGEFICVLDTLSVQRAPLASPSAHVACGARRLRNVHVQKTARTVTNSRPPRSWGMPMRATSILRDLRTCGDAAAPTLVAEVGIVGSSARSLWQRRTQASGAKERERMSPADELHTPRLRNRLIRRTGGRGGPCAE